MLNALSRHGLVRQVVLGEYESEWQLSMLAMTISRPTITLKEPKHFFIAREATPIEEWSALECAVMLHMEGWSHKMLDSGERMNTANYMGGNENRVWRMAFACRTEGIGFALSSSFVHGKHKLCTFSLIRKRSWHSSWQIRFGVHCII